MVHYNWHDKLFTPSALELELKLFCLYMQKFKQGFPRDQETIFKDIETP